MIYNVNYDIAAIFIYVFILIVFFLKKEINKASNDLFFVLCCCGLIAAVSDIVSSVGNSYVEEWSYAARDVWNYIYLTVHCLSSTVFFAYIICLLGINRKMHTRHYVLLSIPAVCVLGTLALNPALHWVFYYDENRIYSHGGAMLPLQGFALFYMAASVYLVIRYFGALNKTKRVALITFIVFSSVPVLMQWAFEHVLINIFCQSLGMLGVLLSIDNEDEIINRITGVYNRYRFIQDAETAIKTGLTAHFTVVKLADLDYYNSTFGLGFVTELQKRTAEKLKEADRKAACYDCENGHFVLIRYNTDDSGDKTFIGAVGGIFEQEQSVKGLQTSVHAQLCVVKLPESTVTLEQMLMSIDIPIARTVHKTAVVPFDVFSGYHREMLVESLIRKSLENSTLEVWYQPIIDARTNKIRSAEALVRLHDAELGFISPEEFIPICEKNGLIVRLGEYVFRTVCRNYTESGFEAIGIDYVEVNLSVVQCMNTGLAESFGDIMAETGIAPSRINLEITESAAVSNQKILTRAVEELQKLGIGFSMDDYGTGYSNYTYMYSLPFGIIKLDKSILWAANDNENNRILLESTIEMLHKMKYHIVCEGVETVEQKEMLTRLGCDYMQGYYFSKPVPVDTFVDYVRLYNS